MEQLVQHPPSLINSKSWSWNPCTCECRAHAPFNHCAVYTYSHYCGYYSAHAYSVHTTSRIRAQADSLEKGVTKESGAMGA